MFVFSPKFSYWLKILSQFVSVQLTVKVLGFASGILLIQALSKQEYSYFILANSLQATMNVFADSGISSALSAIGGRVWQDPYRFGQLINTAMRCRNYLAIIAITVFTPFLIWTLLKNGASIGYTILLVIGVLIELQFYLTEGVLIVVPRLHSQFSRIQTLAFISAGSRLAIIGGASLVFLNAAVGVFASTIASGVHNLFLRHLVKDAIDSKAPFDSANQKEIFKLVKTQIPSSIFYCLQGQLTVWLISIFGNTENIAEVGALGRLGVIFTLIGSVMADIVLPSFSRCQTYSALVNRYCQVLIFYCLVGGALTGLAALYPQQLLWILGTQYANLGSEVVLVVFSTAVSSIVTVIWHLNCARGWITQAWLSIPTVIAMQALLLLILDVSTVRGVILFNLFSLLPVLGVNAYMTYSGFKTIEAS